MNWETGSVASDISGTTGDSDGKAKSFLKRLGRKFKKENPFEDIDTGIRSLYQDVDLLEEKCALSMKGTISTPVISMGVPTKDEKKERFITQDASHYCNKTAESVIKSLPPGYFTSTGEYDPVALIPHEVSTWGTGDLNEQFMNKIEDVDTDKDMILSSLADLIEANYTELMGCMTNVYDIDLDLSRAGMQVVNCRRNIAEASNVLVDGAMGIAQLQAKRERLILAATMAKSLKALMDVHRAMLNDVIIGNLAKAAEGASSLLFSILLDKQNNEDSGYGLQLKALFNMKAGVVKKSVITIRQKSDRALHRLCSRKFNKGEYSDIVRAYLVLDYIAETLSVPLCEAEDGTENMQFYGTNGCAEGLAPRVLRFLNEDIETCLHSSVVEFLYASQHKLHKAAKDMDMQKNFHAMGMDEIMELADAPLQHLYTLVNAESAAQCIVRSCELLTDIVHTHYLITQWHVSPFDSSDEGGGDGEHSTPHIQDDIKTKITASFIQNWHGGYSGKASNRESDEGDKKILGSLRGARLAVVYERLLADRTSLWSSIIAGQISMIKAITLSAAVSGDDFFTIVWAIKTMVRFGHEFCGSDSMALIDCFVEKSKEYYQQFHLESFVVLREMVESEGWQAVPVLLDGMGGILGILKRNAISPKCKYGCTYTSNDIDGKSKNGSSKKYSILSSFWRHGNPFQMILEEDKGESVVEQDEEIDWGKREEKTGIFSTGANIREDVKLEKVKVLEHDGNDIGLYILCDKFTVFMREENGHEKETFIDTVVTQTCLNGLARCTGRYLQMMYMLPSVSGDIFPLLCQLYDYYVCAVYCGFVPTEQQKLSKYARALASTPERSNEFEAANSYLERAMVEMIHLQGKGNLSDGNESPHRKKSSHNIFEDRDILSGAQRVLFEDREILSGAQRVFGGILPHKRKEDSQVSSSTHDSLGAVADTNPLPLSSSHGGTGTNTLNNSQGKVEESQAVKLASMLGVPECIRERGDDVKLFYALSEKIVAIESCGFLAKMLNEIKLKITELLPVHGQPSCMSYIERFQIVVNQVQILIYRSLCPQLLQTSKILLVINDDKKCIWDSKKIRQTSHEWVFELSERCGEIWRYLQLQGSTIPEAAKEIIWAEMCDCAFDTALEGFSRIRKCSAEGRLAMSLDIADLQAGLDSIRLPKPSSIPPDEDASSSSSSSSSSSFSRRNKDYVDNYIQTTYMPEEDLMMWISENYKQYSYRHIFGLIRMLLNCPSIMSIAGSSKRYNEAIGAIDVLYGVEKEGESGNKMLSHMFKREKGGGAYSKGGTHDEALTDWASVELKEQQKKEKKEKISSRLAKQFRMPSMGSS